MSKLQLILAFHNYQPIGNFDHVLEDCCAMSSLLFLETLSGHPELKAVLHNVAAGKVDYGEETR